MPKDITQVPLVSIRKWVLELWPYLFIAVSVVGLAYVALGAYPMSH